MTVNRLRSAVGCGAAGFGSALISGIGRNYLEFRDRLQDPAAVSYRTDANLAQVIASQARENPRIDVVAAERLDILRETEVLKPICNVHGIPDPAPHPSRLPLRQAA